MSDVNDEHNMRKLDDEVKTELRKTTVTLRIATLFKKIIGNCWKDVGAFLEVPEDELDSIDKSNKDVQEKAGAMLKLWRDREGHCATVGCLETALNQIEQQRIADRLLDIAQTEKRREGERKGNESEEHLETCSSPLKEGENGLNQTRDKGVSPEMMLSTAGEVNASRTGGMEQSERGDEPRGERWSLDESKRVERLEKVRQSNLLKRKTRVDERSRIQQNRRRNDLFETRHSLQVAVTFESPTDQLAHANSPTLEVTILLP